MTGFHTFTEEVNFNVFSEGLLSRWTRRRSMVFLPGRSSLEDLSISFSGVLHSYSGELLMVVVNPSQPNLVHVIREILAGYFILLQEKMILQFFRISSHLQNVHINAQIPDLQI